MKNIWTIIIGIIVLFIALRLLGLILHIGFALIKFFLPILLVGFAIYGVVHFLQRR